MDKTLRSWSDRKGTKGESSRLLRKRILNIVLELAIFTVRQLYYVLISRFLEYESGRRSA